MKIELIQAWIDHLNEDGTYMCTLCISLKFMRAARNFNYFLKTFLKPCTLGKFNYLGKGVGEGELPEGDDTIPLEPMRETTVQE